MMSVFVMPKFTYALGDKFEIKKVCNPLIQAQIGDTVRIIHLNETCAEMVVIRTNEWFILNLIDIPKYMKRVK